MSLAIEFARFSRTFANSPAIISVAGSDRETHAKNVSKWLALTEELSQKRNLSLGQIDNTLENAMESAVNLFMKGDDISALLGQLKITRAAERLAPGETAAVHIAAALRFNAAIELPGVSDSLIARMRIHFDEFQYHLAALYWLSRGILFRLHANWTEAISAFSIALDRLKLADPAAVKKITKLDYEQFKYRIKLSLVDCWINLGWEADEKERAYCYSKAYVTLEEYPDSIGNSTVNILRELNHIELMLLKGHVEDARNAVQRLRTRPMSGKNMIFRPSIFCLKARIAELEGNHSLMITELSRSVADSIRYPNAIQEYSIIQFGLNLIRENMLTREQVEPFLHAIVMMLEAKDWYTGRDHSSAVAKMAVQLWEIMHPESRNSEDLKDIYWAGYLHDIGKLLLPRSLLNKLGPLSPKEWELIHLHPIYGREIMLNFGNVAIANLIAEHHQNMLGSGYPGNVPASEKGLCIAVADYLEASTSANRKYKRPKSREESLMEFMSFAPECYPEALIKAVLIRFRQ